MTKDGKNVKLAGPQQGFEFCIPQLQMNKSHQVTWNFDLLVGTGQGDGAVFQDLCEDLGQQVTGSAPHTVKALCQWEGADHCSCLTCSARGACISLSDILLATETFARRKKKKSPV